MSNSNIKHLDSLCIVHADFDIWSGQTRLTAEDLKLRADIDLPPEKLALLGSKKICDPARMKPFHRIKSRTRRLLEHYGLPFLNGVAVPVSSLDAILTQLDKIALEFEAERVAFLNTYDHAIEEWVKENPGYEELIRSGAMPREVVKERIGFDYQSFNIAPVAADGTGASHDRLGKRLGGLSDDLFNEIVKEANTFYEERLKAKSELGRATRPTLKGLRDKVHGLCFLNQAFRPLVGLLDGVLNVYDQSAGKIVAPDLYQVTSAVLIMCSREKIEGYADGSVTVDGLKDAALVATAPVWSGREDLLGSSVDASAVSNQPASPEPVVAYPGQAHSDTLNAPLDKQEPSHNGQIAEVVDQSQGLSTLMADMESFFQTINAPSTTSASNADASAETALDQDVGTTEELGQATANTDDQSVENPETLPQSVEDVDTAPNEPLDYPSQAKTPVEPVPAPTMPAPVQQQTDTPAMQGWGTW